MLLSILSGLVVSVDAFFIGISLGLQKQTRYRHLVAINVFLLGLCILGHILAMQLLADLPFDADLLVGIVFIALGVWTITHHFIANRIRKSPALNPASMKSTALIGLVMSAEAMFVTMGITLIFLPYATVVIPLTVALAHFVYSSLSFGLTRTRHVARMPNTLSHVISGLALVAYGIMALFVDFGI